MDGHLVLINLAGGVALLLWATRMVRTGIQRAYGADLRRLIGRSTRSRLGALAMGLGVSTALQSSTATALLTVSFASRSLITVAAGLAVMLGADIGSTIVVQILSFDLGWASPLLIVTGVVLFNRPPNAVLRHMGRVLIGLGLLLLSLDLILAGTAPLRESETLSLVIAPLSSDPVLAVLLAAGLTWLVHSSVAVVLLVMSLAAGGVVPVALGFALVLGANIGSGLIPLGLTYGQDPRVRRIPLGNFLFRLVGALLALPLIALVAPYITALEGDSARQIANYHTLFNLALAVLCLPFTGLAATLCARLLPEQDQVESASKPRYLDDSLIDTPQVALAVAAREVLRMADLVEEMLKGVIDVLRDDDTKLLSRLNKQDDDVDHLYEAIKIYLTKVSRDELDEDEGQACIELIAFTTNLEHIGDIIDKNLLETADKKAKRKLTFSDEGWSEILDMHGRVVQQMQLALSVFVSRDLATARRLLELKEEFRELERSGGERHLERLRSGKIESIETSALHMDILRDLKRVNSHLTSVAYPILDAEGALRKSRLMPVDSDDPAGTGNAVGR